MRLVVVFRLVGIEFRLEKIAIDYGTIGILSGFFRERSDDFEFKIDVPIVTSVCRNPVSDFLLEFCQSSFADDHSVSDLFHPFDCID